MLSLQREQRYAELLISCEVSVESEEPRISEQVDACYRITHCDGRIQYVLVLNE